MNPASYTPGPWQASGYDDECLIQAWTVWSGKVGEPRICTCTNGKCSEANARLIAAAPELLDVVKRFAKYCEQHRVPELQGIACDAFAAIAKAAQPEGGR